MIRELRSWILLVLAVSTALALMLVQRSTPSGTSVMINNTAVPPVPVLDPDRVARGAILYAENCATCHGANLEGAPDWKRRLPDGSLPPPPHDSSGHTWHHPDALLLSIIANGGDPATKSKMPAFKDKLTQDEMMTILEFINSKWGEKEREFQWWMTATGNNP